MDATIAGHVHAYYRTCPVYDARCATPSAGGSPYLERRPDRGIVHLVAGTAGHNLSDVDRGQEDWLEVKVQQWGYLRVRVEGGEKLVVEYVASESGEVLDSSEIVKRSQWQAQQ